MVFSVKGSLAGGVNEVFIKKSNLKLTPWDDNLAKFDAILLLDVTPTLSYSPLPPP